MSNITQSIIAQDIVEAATAKSLRLVAAESITGGAVASALTDIPGASQVFEAGYVVYTAEAKTALLGIAPSLLEKYGTVSAECARAMALGALGKASQAHSVKQLGVINVPVDIAIATTGNAGPTVDSAGSAVGQTFIAIAVRERNAQPSSESVQVSEYSLSGSRLEIKQQVLTQALERLLAVCEQV